MTSTDVELLHRYLERQDTGALDELFGRHYPAVHRTVRKLVHDDFDANDIAQATFLAAVRSGRRAGPTQSFRAWLLAIAINEVRQFARARRRRPADWLADACLLDPAGSAADAASRREFERALEDALQLLPPRLKEPLVLHYYESLPLGAVSEILALPRSTVQTRVAAAVERLRRAFRRRGHAALLPLLDLHVAPPASAVAAAGVFARLTAGVLAMNGKQFAVVVLAVSALALGTASVWQSLLGPRDPALATPVAAAAAPARSEAAAPAPGDATAAARADERQPLAPPQPMVFGQVVDAARGAPVAGAEVTLFEFATAAAATVRTDCDGRYAFAGSRGSAGLFHLVVSKAGFGRLAAAEVCASLQPRREVLAPGLAIRGRVTEGVGGRPVPAFRVLAARLPFQRGGESDSVVVLHSQAIPEPLRTDADVEVADADGSFCLRDLAPGRYALVIAAPGRPPLFCNGGGRSYDLDRGIDAAPEADAMPVEIALPARGHAFVEVIDRADGTPLRGARVRTRVCIGRGEFLFDLARAGGAGNRFELPMALDARGKLDEVDCLATADGYAPRTLSCSGQDDGDTYAIALGRAAILRGRVRDADGRPLPNATLLVECDTDGRLVGNACTAADGGYRIDGLDAPSASTLRCLSPSLSTVLATLPLQLADGEVRELDLDLGAAAAAGLHGTVSLRGVPQSGALVVLDAPARAEVRCETRADGAFAFAGVRPGRYEVTVVLDAGSIHNLRAERIVSVGTKAQRLDFDFARRVTGAVRDLSRGPPPAGARPPDFAVVAALVGANGAKDCADVGEDGRFELLLAAPGRYELSIDGGEDWVTIAPVAVDLRERDAVDGVELQVARDARDARIELRFVDQASGQPVSGELRWTHARTQAAASVEDGRFVDEEGGLGVYRYRVSSDTHRPVAFEVNVLPGQKQIEQRIALVPAVEVVVTEVAPGGAAHRAGVRAGDVLRRYGAVAIHSVAGLHAAVAAASGLVAIVVARDGIESALTADAGELGVEVENAR